MTASTPRKNKHISTYCAATLALFLAPWQAAAASPNWTAVSGSWATPGNWSTNAVPGTGDTVAITPVDTQDRTITYNYTGSAVTLNSLIIDHLVGGGSPTATTTFNMSANSLTSTAEYVAYSGASTNGRATFNQSGGTNSPGTLLLGYNSTDIGTYNLSGSATLAAGLEYIGVSGAGNFNQSGGTHTIVSAGNALFIGYNSGSTGTYNLTGGALSVTGYEILGYQGTGIMNQSGGTHTVASGFYFSLGSGGGSGIYNLNGGTLVSSSSEYIGSNGTGNFFQTAGTNTITAGNMLVIANLGPSTGTYTLSGTGTTTVNGNAYVGGNNTLSGGKGILNIQGGSMTVTGFISIWNTPNTSLNLSGGILTAQFIDVQNNPSHLNWTGGTISLNSSLAFDTFSASNISFGNSLTFGNSQSLILNATGNGGSNTEILQGSGSFITQTGGLNSTPGINVASFSGAPATYTLSGGLLSVSQVTTVGSSSAGSKGTFIQTGGAHNTSQLQIGFINNGVGVYSISGPSTLAANSILLGTTTGTGTLAIAGGTVTVGTINVDPNNGFLNFTGGTLNVNFLNVAPNSLSWTGGALNYHVGITLGPGSPFGNTLTLTSVKSLADTGPVISAGTVLMTGGTLGGDNSITNIELITGYGFITGAGTLTNSSVMSLANGDWIVNIAGGIINNATVQLAPAFQLNLNAPFSNAGAILNNGTVDGGGSLTNTPGGVITGTGNITSPFSNAGLVTAGPGNLFITGFTNTGIIEMADAAANLTVTGGTFDLINSGTIEGHGKINASLDNFATVEATNGTLIFSGAFANVSGGLIAADAGAKILMLPGVFTTNFSVISLTGGTFDNSGSPLNNTGQISGFGTFRTGGLTNNGTILFTGGSTTVNGPVTNAASHTITIKDQPAIFTGPVINNGTIKTTSTVATFAGGYSGSGQFLSDPSINIFSTNVTVGLGGTMSGGVGDQFLFSNGTFTINGTFSNGGLLQSSNNPTINNGTFFQSGPQTWSPNSTFTNSGTATFASDAGSSSNSPLSITQSAGNLTLASTQHLNALTLTAGTATITASYTKLNTLQLAHTNAGTSANYTSFLQLNNNKLILQSTDPTDKAAKILAINEALFAGHNGTAQTWSGTQGITSSTVAADSIHLVLAVFDNAHIGRANFGGGINNVDANNLLLSPALKGDLNLDGVVDVNDLALLGAHWQQTGISNGISTLDMTQGDINQDGKVDVNDLALLGANWQGTSNFNLTTALSDPAFMTSFTTSTTPVPEPAASALLLLAVPLLWRRRGKPERRRASLTDDHFSVVSIDHAFLFTFP